LKNQFSHGTIPSKFVRRRWRPWLGLLLLSALSGCALLPQPEIRPTEATVPSSLPAPPGGTDIYRIERARLTIHTYRAGWLQRLAHNHVMTTTSLGGAIYLAELVQDSTAVVYFRPWDLDLDNPDERAAAGSGFESERTPSDIAATRTRMLGPQGFHSNDHPFVIARISWVSQTRVGLAIRFRDGDVVLEAPMSWSTKADRLQVTTDLELSHEALGIRPYSAFLGAIAVAQPIRIQLQLSATRVGRL